MSKTYKMVFLDLDGTTLNKEAKITPRTNRILKHLETQGVPVVINTGRSIYSTRRVVSVCELDSPVIALNGAVTFEVLHGSVRKYQSLSEEILAEFLLVSREQEEIDNLLFEGLQQYYTLQADDDIRKIFIEVREKDPTIIDLNHRFNEPITNFLIRPKEKNKVYDWFTEQLTDKLRIVKTEWHWMEVMNPNAHKGNAMAEVAQTYGVSLEEVVAFGDEWNDYEMIEMAGLGVVMENGNPEVKEVADLIAPHHDKDGVAIMLEEIFSDLLVRTKY